MKYNKKETNTLPYRIDKCPRCKEKLKDNKSTIFPYECSCGVWFYDYMENSYRVQKKVKRDYK